MTNSNRLSLISNFIYDRFDLRGSHMIVHNNIDWTFKKQIVPPPIVEIFFSLYI